MDKQMTSRKRAIGLVAVTLFAGVVAAHGADYSEGEKAYVRGDYPTALRIFRQLAAQGDADSQFGLGVMYDNGQGVPQDYVQAHMWYNLAGAQGDEEARKRRDIIAKKMSVGQIAEAQKLAREWKPKGK